MLFIVISLVLSACQPPVTPAPARPTPDTQPATPQATDPAATATQAAPDCSAAEGEVRDLQITARTNTENMQVKVYLPPCYGQNDSAGYPALYLLHGQDADNHQWIDLGITRAADTLIAAGQIPPLIIVLPGEQNPLQSPQDSSFGSEIIQSLLPYVDAHYSTCTERACRAIGGLSRGGNWAVALGFTHPGLFTAVGAHSTPLFYGQAAQIRQSVTEMNAPSDAPFLYVDVGDKDMYYANVAEFVSTLEELGVPYQYTEFAGKHEPAYWSAHVSNYLLWYGEHLMNPEDPALPTPAP